MLLQALRAVSPGCPMQAQCLRFHVYRTVFWLRCCNTAHRQKICRSPLDAVSAAPSNPPVHDSAAAIVNPCSVRKPQCINGCRRLCHEHSALLHDANRSSIRTTGFRPAFARFSAITLMRNFTPPTTAKCEFCHQNQIHIANRVCRTVSGDRVVRSVVFITGSFTEGRGRE